MEVVIRIGLMFFFIQFLVVVTIMSVALLLAKPEVPVFRRDPGASPFTRSMAFVMHLPSRGFRFLVRRLQSMHLRSVQ